MTTAPYAGRFTNDDPIGMKRFRRSTNDLRAGMNVTLSMVRTHRKQAQGTRKDNRRKG